MIQNSENAPKQTIIFKIADVMEKNCSSWSPEPDFHGTVHVASLAVCTVLVIFVLVMGCFGNGTVLFAALKCKKLRTNFDLLILNLAGADFIMCSCLAPIFLFLLFSEPPTPKVFCGSILFLGTASGLLSLLSLVAVALHRQARVTGQTRTPLTLAQAAIILAGIWLLSLGLALGGTLYVTGSWRDSLINCQIVINSHDQWSHNFVLFFLAPVAIVSFTIIAVSYLVIAWAVQSQNRAPIAHNAGEKATENEEKLLRDNGQRFGPPKHCSICAAQSLLDKGNKAMTMCLVVILTICLCWGPLIISQFVELATGESIILYQVKLCGIALVFLNSALDPYIYAQNSVRIKKRYRNFFRQLIGCGCQDNRRSRLRTVGGGTVDTNKNRSSHNDGETNTAQLIPTKSKIRPNKRNGTTNPLIGDTASKNILVTQTKKAKCEQSVCNVIEQKSGQLGDFQTVVKDVKNIVHKSCCSPSKDDVSSTECRS